MNITEANLQDLFLLYSYPERAEILEYLLLSPRYAEGTGEFNPVLSHVIQFYSVLEVAARQGYVSPLIPDDLGARASLHLSHPAFRSQQCQSRPLLDALRQRLQSRTEAAAPDASDTHDLLAHLLGLISRVRDDIYLEELRQGLRFGAQSRLILLPGMLRHNQQVFSALTQPESSPDSRLLSTIFRLFRLLVEGNSLLTRADPHQEFRSMVACVVGDWLYTQNKLAGAYVLCCVDRVEQWPASVGANPAEWPHSQATSYLETVRLAVRQLYGVSSVPLNLHIPVPEERGRAGHVHEDLYATGISPLMTGSALERVQMESLYEDLTTSVSGRILRDRQ